MSLARALPRPPRPGGPPRPPGPDRPRRPPTGRDVAGSSAGPPRSHLARSSSTPSPPSSGAPPCHHLAAAPTRAACQHPSQPDGLRPLALGAAVRLQPANASTPPRSAQVHQRSRARVDLARRPGTPADPPRSANAKPLSRATMTQHSAPSVFRGRAKIRRQQLALPSRFPPADPRVPPG